MTKIDLDASLWRGRDDFYDILLAALGAPGWHGRNLDALEESIRGDNILAVREPFTIIIRNSASMPIELSEYIDRFAKVITDARTSRDRRVALKIEL